MKMAESKVSQPWRLLLIAALLWLAAFIWMASSLSCSSPWDDSAHESPRKVIRMTSDGRTARPRRAVPQDASASGGVSAHESVSAKDSAWFREELRQAIQTPNNGTRPDLRRWLALRYVPFVQLDDEDPALVERVLSTARRAMDPVGSGAVVSHKELAELFILYIRWYYGWTERYAKHVMFLHLPKSAGVTMCKTMQSTTHCGYKGGTEAVSCRLNDLDDARWWVFKGEGKANDVAWGFERPRTRTRNAKVDSCTARSRILQEAEASFHMIEKYLPTGEDRVLESLPCRHQHLSMVVLQHPLKRLYSIHEHMLSAKDRHSKLNDMGWTCEDAMNRMEAVTRDVVTRSLLGGKVYRDPHGLDETLYHHARTVLSQFDVIATMDTVKGKNLLPLLRHSIGLDVPRLVSQGVNHDDWAGPSELSCCCSFDGSEDTFLSSLVEWDMKLHHFGEELALLDRVFFSELFMSVVHNMHLAQEDLGVSEQCVSINDQGSVLQWQWRPTSERSCGIVCPYNK